MFASVPPFISWVDEISRKPGEDAALRRADGREPQRRDRDRELGKEGNVVDNLPTVVIRGLNPAPHAVYLPAANSLTAP